jgi:hypothetical protein
MFEEMVSGIRMRPSAVCSPYSIRKEEGVQRKSVSKRHRKSAGGDDTVKKAAPSKR